MLYAQYLAWWLRGHHPLHLHHLRLSQERLLQEIQGYSRYCRLITGQVSSSPEFGGLPTRPDSALVWDLEQAVLEHLHKQVLLPLQVSSLGEGTV